ncbi:uncharacterized protein VP01_1633g2 [Puccinia sorghi]|uniref:Uncharacterized protein n=1 Tax=Puccinia sorghi TaxID=27349 RepID=A0A0L6VHE0_9BASI|nr:uncharacterized protein VP01_1633g2 [Puccinia sorghi]
MIMELLTPAPQTIWLHLMELWWRPMNITYFPNVDLNDVVLVIKDIHFFLSSTFIPSSACSAALKVSGNWQQSLQWHNWLGHDQVIKDYLRSFVPSFDIRTWVPFFCETVKFHPTTKPRRAALKSEHPSNNKCDLVVSDVLGPVNPADIFGKLQHSLKIIKTQAGVPKLFCCDNAKEYTKGYFVNSDYLRPCGPLLTNQRSSYTISCLIHRLMAKILWNSGRDENLRLIISIPLGLIGHMCMMARDGDSGMVNPNNLYLTYEPRATPTQATNKGSVDFMLNLSFQLGKHAKRLELWDWWKKLCLEELNYVKEFNVWEVLEEDPQLKIAGSCSICGSGIYQRIGCRLLICNICADSITIHYNFFFLIDEDVYVQPPGELFPEFKGKFLKLKKVLYGNKQALYCRKKNRLSR